jgi:hypothetical protein
MARYSHPPSIRSSTICIITLLMLIIRNSFAAEKSDEPAPDFVPLELKVWNIEFVQQIERSRSCITFDNTGRVTRSGKLPFVADITDKLSSQDVKVAFDAVCQLFNTYQLQSLKRGQYGENGSIAIRDSGGRSVVLRFDPPFFNLPNVKRPLIKLREVFEKYKISLFWGNEVTVSNGSAVSNSINRLPPDQTNWVFKIDEKPCRWPQDVRALYAGERSLNFLRKGGEQSIALSAEPIEEIARRSIAEKILRHFQLRDRRVDEKKVRGDLFRVSISNGVVAEFTFDSELLAKSGIYDEATAWTKDINRRLKLAGCDDHFVLQWR